MVAIFNRPVLFFDFKIFKLGSITCSIFNFEVVTSTGGVCSKSNVSVQGFPLTISLPCIMNYANYYCDNNHIYLPHFTSPEKLSSHTIPFVHSCSTVRVISPSPLDLNIHIIDYVNFSSSVVILINVHLCLYPFFSCFKDYVVTHKTLYNDVSSSVNFSGSSAFELSTCLLVHLPYN